MAGNRPFMAAIAALALAGAAIPAMAQCGDVYAGTWENPPFQFNIYKDQAVMQSTSGVFDAPDQTPIALDASGNVFHAQTIDAQGTVRVLRNNQTLHTFGARGGPSWVYSGLALAVEPGGSWYTAFYSAENTVTVYKDGATPVASFTAHTFNGSAVGLAYEPVSGTLYVSVRTGANTVTVYKSSGAVAANFTAAGVPIATRGGKWYAAVPVTNSSIQVYENGAAAGTITGSFSAGSRFPLAVDGDGDPFVLVSSGGGFALVGEGGPVYTLPNTAGGGGTGLAIFAAAPCSACKPDLTLGAIPGQPGYGVPNGVVNNDDFFYYLAQFAAGNLAVADLTNTAIPGSPGYGVPNGVLNNDDFFYYLVIFSAGC